MAETRGKRSSWKIAVGLSIIAVIVATIIGVGAFSGRELDSVDGAEGAAGAAGAGGVLDSTGEADGSQPPDAATEGLPESEGGDRNMQDQEYVPNEALVMVDDPAVLDTLTPGTKVGDALIKSVEVLSDDLGEGSVVKITLEGDASTESSIDALNAMEGVSAQKNFIYHLM